MGRVNAENMFQFSAIEERRSYPLFPPDYEFPIDDVISGRWRAVRGEEKGKSVARFRLRPAEFYFFS